MQYGTGPTCVQVDFEYVLVHSQTCMYTKIGRGRLSAAPSSTKVRKEEAEKRKVTVGTKRSRRTA